MAMRARGFDSPIACHHTNGSRDLVEIVGVFRYSSSSSVAISVPKSSNASNKSSRGGPWNHFQMNKIIYAKVQDPKRTEDEDCEDAFVSESLLGL
jgi:hypothetical protein